MLELIVTGDDPRILDIDLAIALGMKAPRNIRNGLIVPNAEELKRYGSLHSIRANPGKPGRPAYEYHLNEDQAALICMFSRTEKAADVRQEIIRVFKAYRDGHLELSATGKVALPDFENPAEAARAFADLWETRTARQSSGPIRKNATPADTTTAAELSPLGRFLQAATAIPVNGEMSALLSSCASTR